MKLKEIATAGKSRSKRQSILIRSLSATARTVRCSPDRSSAPMSRRRLKVFAYSEMHHESTSRPRTAGTSERTLSAATAAHLSTRLYPVIPRRIHCASAQSSSVRSFVRAARLVSLCPTLVDGLAWNRKTRTPVKRLVTRQADWPA